MELKPCPFCGSRLESGKDEGWERQEGKPEKLLAVCPECNATAPIKTWNRCAPDGAVEAARDAVRTAISQSVCIDPTNTKAKNEIEEIAMGHFLSALKDTPREDR